MSYPNFRQTVDAFSSIYARPTRRMVIGPVNRRMERLGESIGIVIPAAAASLQTRRMYASMLWPHFENVNVNLPRARWEATLFTYLAVIVPGWDRVILAAAAGGIAATYIGNVEAAALHKAYDLITSYGAAQATYNQLLTSGDTPLGRALATANAALPPGAAPLVPASLVPAPAQQEIDDYDAMVTFEKMLADMRTPQRSGLVTDGTPIFKYAHIHTNITNLAHALAGIMVFLSGKRITDQNITSVTQKHPNALIRKFQFNQDAAQFLNGVHRMSDVAIRAINAAWSVYIGVRRQIIKAVAAFATNTVNPEKDALYTTAGLLAWNGMGHIHLILKFLSAHPRAREWPRVKNDIKIFFSALEGLASFPSLEQPFLKVMYGDSMEALKLQSVNTLFNIALETIKITDRALLNLTSPSGAAADMATYVRFARASETIDELERERARLLGQPAPLARDADDIF